MPDRALPTAQNATKSGVYLPLDGLERVPARAATHAVGMAQKPINLTPTRIAVGTRPAVAWRTREGSTYSAVPTPALLDEGLYLAGRSRVGNNYQWRRNYAGVNWFSSCGTHVEYESMFERLALLWLDFSSDIVAIAAQPMLMLFEDETHHYPDFIALHADHRQVVYDVKPAALVTDKARKQFDNTAALCRRVGWDYHVLTGTEPVLEANLNWLAQFRQPVFAPPTDARQRLLAAVSDPIPLAEAAAAMQHPTPTAARASIYHLAWIHEIQLDLTRPLSNQTLIRKAAHVFA